MKQSVYMKQTLQGIVTLLAILSTALWCYIENERTTPMKYEL